MRNPFTVLKSVVSSLFKGRKPAPPVYSPKPQPAHGIMLDLDDEDRAVLSTFRKMGKTPISREEPRAHAPEPDIIKLLEAEDRAVEARNHRRKARAEVRAFLLKLNRVRG